MTSSTVTLRIQELAEAQGLSFEELSKASGVSQQDIQAYAAAPVELTEGIAANIRKIAEALKVAVVELVEPVVKRQAVKLKIREIAQQRGLTLEKLSQDSKIHLLLIEFYTKQPIYKHKMFELKLQEHFTKICQVLDCKIESLMVEVEAEYLPDTKLRLEEIAEERGLSLRDLSLLTELPYELIDLLATQPIDTSIFDDDVTPEGEEYVFRPIICKYFRDLFRRCRR